MYDPVRVMLHIIISSLINLIRYFMSLQQTKKPIAALQNSQLNGKKKKSVKRADYFWICFFTDSGTGGGQVVCTSHYVVALCTGSTHRKHV